MERVFKKIDGELRSGPEHMLSSPLSVVGAFSDDEQLMRLFYRVYELGREDQKRDFRNMIGVQP